MTTRPKLPVKMPGQLLGLQNGGSNASIPVAQWPGSSVARPKRKVARVPFTLAGQKRV